MSDKTAKVILAYPTTINGRDYQPDDVVELPLKADYTEPSATQFVIDGRARWADADAVPKAAKKVAARATNTTQEG